MAVTDYGMVTEKTINELVELLGIDSVSIKEDEITNYSTDETLFPKPHAPQVIVKSADTTAVSKLMSYASHHKIPVTPRGAGTGMSGGAVPIFGGIVLSLERMNRIIEIDTDNFTATVEPAVTLIDLQTAVADKGLYYPIHTGEMTSSIGGNVSTNAGGLNAVKYGVTRHHVLGLEAVLPNGDIIKTGGKFVKCSTGYELTQLITGSEGTLAVVTSSIMKLSPRLTQKEVLYVPFPDLQNAVDAVPEILRLDIIPSGLEFLERSVVEIIEKHVEDELPYHQYEAFLMIITEGNTTEEIINYFAVVEDICKRHGAIDAMVPNSERAKRKLIHAREQLYPALKRFAPVEVIDTVVPRSQIAVFMKQVKKIAEEHGVPIIGCGHAGDGNVHLHPICINMDVEVWRKKLPAILRQVYQIAISLGGAISGEHGIGIEKKDYLEIEMNQEKLDLMRRIKKAFDPNNILNPGKIF